MAALSPRLPLKTPHHYPPPWGPANTGPPFFLGCISGWWFAGFGLLPAAPPDFGAAPQAPYGMMVHRQHEQSQRQHPEAEDRQETQKASSTEHATQNGALRLRSGNAQAELSKSDALAFTHPRNRRCLEQEIDIGTPPRTR